MQDFKTLDDKILIRLHLNTFIGCIKWFVGKE